MRHYLFIFCLVLLSACSPQTHSHDGSEHDADKAHAEKPEAGFHQTLKDISDKPAEIDSKKANDAMKRVHDGPLVFSSHAIEKLKDATLLSRYICEAVESHLQDRSLLRQQFSPEFTLATLGELPVSLQRTYATCHIEKALRTGGFEDYFRDEGDLLVKEALLGYGDMGALEHLKLLKRAQELAKAKPTSAKSQAETRQFLADIDKLWHKQNRKQLLKKRAAVIHDRFEANAWPVS